MKTLELVTGPHVLYTGANGVNAYGITVRSTKPKSEVEDQGYSRQWDVNDLTLLKDYELNGHYCDWLGLTFEAYNAMIGQIKELVRA